MKSPPYPTLFAATSEDCELHGTGRSGMALWECSRSRRSASIASPMAPGSPLCWRLEANRISATAIPRVRHATTRGTVIGGSSRIAPTAATAVTPQRTARGRKRRSSIPSSSHRKYVVIGISEYWITETTKHRVTPHSRTTRVSAWLWGLPVRHDATGSPR